MMRFCDRRSRLAFIRTPEFEGFGNNREASQSAYLLNQLHKALFAENSDQSTYHVSPQDEILFFILPIFDHGPCSNHSLTNCSVFVVKFHSF